MRIAKQGWRFIGPGVAAGAAGVVLCVRPGPCLAAGLLSVLGFGFALFCVYFFRDPERPLPADAKRIYSPGDGVVLSVAREGPGETVTLRIFLSVFNVHIQRAPCAATVTDVAHMRGSFRAAMKAEANANERVVMTLQPEGREPLVVEQIAGYIARRIECWPRPGAKLLSGQRYGIIYFGSQAAVHFPASARCTVKVGDKVAGALSPIGEWIS